MKLARLADKIAAIAHRDLLTAVRYRNGFLLAIGGATAELAAFYFLARAIGPSFRPDGMDYFPFVLIGTGFYTFLIAGINSFLHIITDAQQTGTLEVLMTTSTRPSVLVMLSALSAFAGNSVYLLLYLGAGFFLFGAPIHTANLLGCAIILALSLLIATALGLLAAALQLEIQKGSALVWLFASGTWFLTGTLFPVNALPAPLRVVAQLLPLTHSLNGMRLALLQGANFTTLLPEISALALFALGLIPFSLFVFSYSLQRARLNGTLSFY